jgi:glycosyltransferase involved in cell wall biosynthesis
VKVLFVNQTGRLGGGELSLLEIARHFRDEATVVLLSDGPLLERLTDAGVPTVRLPTHPRMLAVRRESGRFEARAVAGAVAAAVRLARLARRHDVMYANSQKAFVVAAIAATLARRPLIWHLRDILSGQHFSLANVRLVVTLANRVAHRVIANSQASADAFIAAGGRSSKLRVIYSGVDPAPFLSVAQADIDVARAQLASAGRAAVLGLFGRLSPWKGQHVALQALPALPGAHLLVVGAPLFGEEAYEGRLRRLAGELGVTERVSFLGSRSDVPVLMGLVDVVLHTSTEPEPFGRVLVEGMLAGKPVVATRAGGAAEIVEDGVTGRLVTPGDSGALADAIRELLVSETMRDRMGQAGRARACRLFRSQWTLEQIAGVLAETVR